MTLSLDILNQEELEIFEKFVNSPFFNSRDKITALFNQLKHNPNATREDVFPSLYPGEKYNDVRIRRLFSDFTVLIEKFLGYLSMQKWKDDFVYVKTLETLMEKGLGKRFQTSYKRISKNFKRKFVKNDAYYRNLSQIEILNYYVTSDMDSLVRCINNIDLEFIFSKLHRYRDVLLLQLQSRKEIKIQMGFLDEIIKYINKNVTIIKKDHPNLYIIYLTVMAMSNNDNESYLNELYKYLKQNGHRFTKKGLGYYYNYLVSCYWQGINKGRKEYYKNALEIYKHMESQGLFKAERFIPHHVFNNVVLVASANYEYNWLRDFINGYRKRISPEFSNDVYNVSMARLYFSNSDYSNSLRYLNDITYKNPNYYINSKTLLSQIKYELGDFEGVKYVIDSFRHYAKTNGTLVKQQVSNINMTVKYFRLLVKSNKKGRIEALRMKTSLDNEKAVVPSKAWFYEKLVLLS